MLVRFILRADLRIDLYFNQRQMEVEQNKVATDERGSLSALRAAAKVYYFKFSCCQWNPKIA